MPKMRNALWLYMKAKGLKDKDVALVLGVAPITVRIWKCNSTRNITDNDFKLLKFILGDTK